MSTITSAVGMLPRLKHLNVSGTWVGDEAAVGLAAALRSSRALESVSLDGAGLRDPGACALIAELASKNGEPLRALSLRDNEMGLEACAQLSAMIGAASSGLTYLDCTANQLTLGGAEQVAIDRPPHILPSSPQAPMRSHAHMLTRSCAHARMRACPHVSSHVCACTQPQPTGDARML